MKRREFLKTGSLTVAGLGLAGSNLNWLIQEASAAAETSGEVWRFGVMADTQWSVKTDAANPGTCAVGIINKLNQQFIDHGVKFVVQVGDLVDSESWTNLSGKTERTLGYRASAAQALYSAGIGFFPLRGNHEASKTAAAELPALFPQTQGLGNNLFGTSNVLASSVAGLNGLSYAIDYNNVRIVLIDQFTRTDGSGSDNATAVIDQLGWIDTTLQNRSTDQHAFVMAHKNLIGQNHADCLFGASSTTNQPSRNAFISSMQANKVGYCVGGHDHMHHRSLIASPDGTASVEQIICSSNSYKFYIPKSSPNDTSGREKVVAQELFTVGYYIYTVDGPCVTVDYYSSTHGSDYGDLDLKATPTNMAFFRRERFGYSLNGKQFMIANNETYTTVQDSFGATSMRILGGVNADTTSDSDYNAREEIKTVKTGWRDQPTGAASAVLKLWGLTDNLDLFDAALTGLLPNQEGPSSSDVYALSLTYDASKVRPSTLVTGKFALAARDADGNWVNAVDLNAGGTKKFVYGAWKPAYGLGTYGVNPATHSVWAVINHDGDFVAC